MKVSLNCLLQPTRARVSVGRFFGAFSGAQHGERRGRGDLAQSEDDLVG